MLWITLCRCVLYEWNQFWHILEVQSVLSFLNPLTVSNFHFFEFSPLSRYYKIVSSPEQYSLIVSKLRDEGISFEPDNGYELLPVSPIEVLFYLQ